MAADFTLAEQTLQKQTFAFCPGVRVGLMERTVFSWVTFNKPCDHRKKQFCAEQCTDPKR